MILTPLQRWPKNVGNLGKSIVAKGFEKMPKVQKKCQIWSHCLQMIGMTTTAAVVNLTNVLQSEMPEP